MLPRIANSNLWVAVEAEIQFLFPALVLKNFSNCGANELCPRNHEVLQVVITRASALVLVDVGQTVTSPELKMTPARVAATVAMPPQLIVVLQVAPAFWQAIVAGVLKCECWVRAIPVMTGGLGSARCCR